MRAQFGLASANELAQAHLAVGRNLLERKRDLDALHFCCEASDYDVFSADAHFYSGQALVNLKRLDQGVEELETALELTNPSQTGLRIQICDALGNAHIFRSDAKKATHYFRLGLKEDREWLDGYRQVGIGYHVAGQYEKAQAFWHAGHREQRRLAEARDIHKARLRFMGPSWLMAIGHVAQMDSYIKMGLLGLRPKTKLYMVVEGLKIPNKHLLNYWSDHVNFIDWSSVPVPHWQVPLLTDEFWSFRFPDGQTRWWGPGCRFVQKLWESENRAPLLKLTEDDRRFGEEGLRRLGVPEGAWYVCLHVREPSFHKDWNQRHPATRDADIKTYSEAIKAVTDLGGWVIRMGDATMQPLPPMERTVDYAHSELKSERMDVFLCGSARFFIGTNSGLGQVPQLFGVPCVLTNWTPMRIPNWYGRDLWIPKLCYDEKKTRYVSFREMLAGGLGYWHFRNLFDAASIRVIDNTPEELASVTRQMLARLDDASAQSPEDAARIARFNKLVETTGNYVGAEIGASFLRAHEDLLDDAQAPAMAPKPARMLAAS